MELIIKAARTGGWIKRLFFPVFQFFVEFFRQPQNEGGSAGGFGGNAESSEPKPSPAASAHQSGDKQKFFFNFFCFFAHAVFS